MQQPDIAPRSQPSCAQKEEHAAETLLETGAPAYQSVVSGDACLNWTQSGVHAERTALHALIVPEAASTLVIST